MVEETCMNPPWKNLVTDCFNSTEFMALGTNGSKGLWVNPVYFVWDESFNLYFISQSGCVHMENIRSNPLVSCAIYPTNRPVGEDVFGAYVKGAARILEDEVEKAFADKIYYNRVYPDNEKGKHADPYRNDPSWFFVKVVLQDLSYFDTRYFGEARVSVPKGFSDE